MIKMRAEDKDESRESRGNQKTLKIKKRLREAEKNGKG